MFMQKLIRANFKLVQDVRVHLVLKRNIRAIRKASRQPLPKYRKDLEKLPTLTGLLTDDLELSAKRNLDALRKDKLEVYKSYLPDNQKPVLLEAIFNKDNDIDRLLKIIDENLDTMTTFYVGVSFEAIDDMMNENSNCKNTVAVSPEFKRLCTKALYKARHFDSDDVLKVLKCLGSLNMAEDLLIVQAALQMTRNLINDFNLDELYTLDKALRRIAIKQDDKRSLLAVLKEAVPLAQARQIEGKYFTKLEQYEEIDSK